MFDFLANLNREKRWPTGGGLLSYVSRKLQLSDGGALESRECWVPANGSLGADGSCSRSGGCIVGMERRMLQVPLCKNVLRCVESEARSQCHQGLAEGSCGVCIAFSRLW